MSRPWRQGWPPSPAGGRTYLSPWPPGHCWVRWKATPETPSLADSPVPAGREPHQGACGSRGVLHRPPAQAQPRHRRDGPCIRASGPKPVRRPPPRQAAVRLVRAQLSSCGRFPIAVFRPPRCWLPSGSPVAATSPAFLCLAGGSPVPIDKVCSRARERLPDRPSERRVAVGEHPPVRSSGRSGIPEFKQSTTGTRRMAGVTWLSGTLPPPRS